MVAACTALAVFAYLIPIAVVVLARARRDRSPWEVALDVPFAVAADLLGVLLLTLVMPVDAATLVARAAWLLGGGAFVTRRWWKQGGRWPAALDPWKLVPVLGSAALAVLVCSPLSGHYFIWDSEWHTAIVSTMTGQRQPFINGLSQSEVLHYHYTGDVLAAMFKTLSWHVISANRALAVAHDTMFALAATTIALLLTGMHSLRGWAIAVAALGVLLHGPLPLRQGLGDPFWGYAYHAFLNLSYRPHYPLGMVLVIGSFGCVLARLLGGKHLSWHSTATTLLTLFTLLGVTDETSAALVGFALGLFWLLHPHALADDRLRGALLLVLAPCLMIAANVLFRASFSPGSPVQTVTLSPTWRVGSYVWPTLPLSSEKGTSVFLLDAMPLIATWLGLALHALRRRQRTELALCVTAAALITLTLLLSLRIQINGDDREVHRFFVATFAFVTLAGIVSFGSMRPGSTARALVVLGTALPAIGQIYWVLQVRPEALAYWSRPPNAATDIFATNCRKAAGASLFEKPRPAYVEPGHYYRFVGCRPTFSTGRGIGPWATKIQPKTDAIPQLSGLDGDMPTRSAPLDVVCSAGATDAVCVRAKRNADKCRREGSDYVRCRLSASERRSLLGRP